MTRIKEVTKKLVEYGTAQKSTSLPLDGRKIRAILLTINGLNSVARDSHVLERAEIKVIPSSVGDADGAKAESNVYIPVYDEISRYKVAPAFKVFVEPRCVYGTVYSYGLANLKKSVKFSDSERAAMLNPVDFQMAQEEVYAAFRKYNINFETVDTINREDSLANVLANVRDDKRAKVESMEAIQRYPIELMKGIVEDGYLDRDLDDVEEALCHQVVRIIATA